jgi:hypothetical protein
MPIQLIIRNPLDRDAREYIGRAGVSDAGGRIQLNEFVRGVKALGLWNSMVCWPLRSTQNAGTGTTAYSLGGLGTFNGTLVNGPTWGTDGIAFTFAGSQYMTATTITASPASYLIGAVVNPATTGAPNSMIVSHNGTSNFNAADIFEGGGNALGSGHRQVAASTFIQPPNQTFTTGAFQMVQQGWDGSTVRRVLNFSSQQTAASAAFGGFISPLRLNARGDTSAIGANKTIAFAYMSQGAGAALVTCSAIYDLYKSTLGTGLGLP